MAYQIDPRKVAGVILETNQILNGRGFNHGEVIIGLSELLGRIVVECSKNAIQTKEMVKIIESQLTKTIEIGSQATQKSIIERV